MIVETLDGRLDYNNVLVHLDNGRYGWNLNLARVDTNNVLNRGWRLVGPEFDTIAQGSRFLGIGQHGTEGDPIKNGLALVAEYDSLFDTPIEFGKEWGTDEIRPPILGRPSLGLSVRLQPNVTKETEAWLERQRRGNESINKVAARILMQLANSNE